MTTNQIEEKIEKAVAFIVELSSFGQVLHRNDFKYLFDEIVASAELNGRKMAVEYIRNKVLAGHDVTNMQNQQVTPATENWSEEFDKFEYSPITPAAVIREQLEWYKEAGRDHGDLVCSEELIIATLKNFIRQTLSHQKETLIAEMVGTLEGMKKPLQEKHDKLQKRYNEAYRLWFDYGHRGEKLGKELKGFETGTNGNIMASCFDKIQAIDDCISSFKGEVK